MRARIANRLLDLLTQGTPDLLIRVQLQILLDTTARGFGAKNKRIVHLSAEEALAAYAKFTVECMEQLESDRAQDLSLQTPAERNERLDSRFDELRDDRRAVLRRLYREAFRTGSRIRRVTGVKESGEIEKLVFYLYRNLQIAMGGHIPGEITVTDCYFSHKYTPQQCAVMSLVDSGVIAGICGGGSLRFTGRITEGCGKCTACFTGERKDQ